MKSNEILHAIGGIDDDIILRAEPGARAARAVRIKKRALFIAAAAIFAAITLTTAIAYGEGITDTIRQILFGDSVAVQLPDPHDDGLIAPYNENERLPFEIKNSSIIDWDNYLRQADRHFRFYPDVEDANKHASFAIRTPSYLPEGAVFLNARIGGPDEEHFYEASVSYDLLLPEGDIWINLWQAYVGEGAFIDIEQAIPMEKILIGGTEALLVYRRLGSSDDDRLIWREMIWIKDNMVFILYSSALDRERGEYLDDDLNMLIAIAESI